MNLFRGCLRATAIGIFAVFVCALLATVLSLVKPTHTSAATSSTINFQARLESGGGAISADGYYNVEFKLYSVSSGGSAEWTEDYTYNSGTGSCTGPLGGNDCRILVINGYLTASLGSATAFPGTINWSQQQWLTMNIGGTTTTGSFPAMGDGEMSPRLLLTAVPYAFQAGQLGTTSGANVATLSFTAPTGADAILLPDASGTVCLQSAAACGFAPSTGGNGYIQLQGSTPGTAQTGNFNITGAGIAGTFQAGTFDTPSGTTTMNIGTTNATQINLNQNTVVATGKTLQVNTLQSAAATALNITGNAASFWQVLGAALTVKAGATLTLQSSGSNTVNIDSTTTGAINIGTNTNAKTITIGNATGATAVTIQGGTGGVNLGTVGAANTIQIGNITGAVMQAINIGTNGTTSSTNNVTIGSTAAGTITLQGSGISESITSGSNTIKTTTNSAAAFQVQNTSGNNLFTVDTTNTAIVFGNDGTPSAMTIRGGAASGASLQGSNLTFAASNGTGAGGSGDLIFQTAAPASNTVITLDNSQSPNFAGSTNTTVSWNHTPNTSTNSILIVSVATTRNQAVATNGVTYEGANLTKLSSQQCGNTIFSPYCEVELWYIVNPSTGGTHQISVTLSPGSTIVAAGSATYDNINTTTPFGSVSTIFGNTSGSQQITNVVTTTSTHQLVIDALATDNVTTSPSGTQLWSSNAISFDFNNGSSNPATGGTANISWNVNSGDYADVAVPLNPVSSSVADTLADRLHITQSGSVGINNSNPQYTLDVAGSARIQTDMNSTTAFQIQNASGTALLTADTTNMQITISALVISTTLTVGGHIVTSGTAPTIAAGSAACTSPTVSVTGDDITGTITITTGTACSSAGQLATITFNSAYAVAPQVELTPVTSAASLLPAYPTASTASFSISTPNTPVGTTTYTFSYFVMQ